MNKQNFEPFHDRILYRFLIIFVLLVSIVVILYLRSEVIQYKELFNGSNNLLNERNKIIQEQQSQLQAYQGYIQGREKQFNDSKPEFQTIAEQVASNHTWEYGKYDCTDFSYDLIHELGTAGWTSVMVKGFWYNLGNKTCSNYDQFHCLHNWVIVQVPVEATTGKIISPEKLKEFYSY